MTGQVDEFANGTEGEGKASDEGKTFNEGLDELEKIIAELESGQLELEDSLKKYERGVHLLCMLQGKLSVAEQKVTVLLGELEPEQSDEDTDSTLS
ncbi:MAG: exodeoxyribonuclease VII small subunit [Coriobacteriales bacterium]